MSDSSNSATRQVLALGGRGWRWVLGSLDALVNDLAANDAAAAGWQAMAILGGNGSRLLVRRSGAVSEVAALPPGAGAVAAAIKNHLTRAEQQGLTLRFAEGRAIVQRIALPASARPVLPAIVRNKIESLAPWPAEDCVWGFVTSEDDGPSLSVTIGILGRRSLQAALQALATIGVKPVEVDIAPLEEGEAPIVIDHNSDLRRKRIRFLVRGAVGGAAAAIASVGLYGAYGAVMDYADLRRTEARTAALTAALTAKPDASAMTPAQAEANALAERKLAEQPFVTVLNELTKGVPNGSWLTAIDVAGTQVTVQGRGGPAPELVQALEKSEAFSDVNFAAATQRDETAGTDVFAITAAIDPQKVPQ